MEEAWKEAFVTGAPTKLQFPKCAHKNRFLKCRECHGDFCSRCIQLEVHFCPKLDERAKIEKENLAAKLVKVQAPKIQMI
jgi:hypothetical protein